MLIGRFKMQSEDLAVDKTDIVESCLNDLCATQVTIFKNTFGEIEAVKFSTRQITM